MRQPIQVRLSEEERSELAEAAGAEGLSSWMRRVCLEKAALRKPVRTGHPETDAKIERSAQAGAEAMEPTDRIDSRPS